jgi:hypothetical protein
LHLSRPIANCSLFAPTEHLAGSRSTAGVFASCTYPAELSAGWQLRRSWGWLRDLSTVAKLTKSITSPTQRPVVARRSASMVLTSGDGTEFGSAGDGDWFR